MSIKINRRRGSVLILIVAASIFICAVGIGLISIIQIFSGARELQNTVDSGVLNMAKQALVLRTEPLDQRTVGRNFVYYVDNGDNNRIALRNLNRIWSHALLVGMNADSMLKSGNAGPNTLQHAQDVHGWAMSRNSDLVNAIYAQVQAKYHEVASQNSTRALQTFGFTQFGHSLPVWPTGFVDRGEPSQMYMRQEQIPPGCDFDWQENTGTQASRPSRYIKGYKRIHLNGINRTFIFVPYRLNDQPHLISKKTFDDNDSATDGPLTLDGTNAVPNAFFVEREAKSPATGLTFDFTACAQSVIVTGDTPAAITGGFIRIENWTDENKTPWEFIHNEPLIGAVRNLLSQRIRQIWADFDAGGNYRDTARIFSQMTIPSGQSAYIFGNEPYQENLRLHSRADASQSTLPGPYLDERPDGILNLQGPEPSLTEIGTFYRLTFYPSTGYNNLLGVFVISPKNRPAPPITYSTFAEWKRSWQ
ncbi:MAG: hypothetical protein K2W82_06735 [Candidatus Obscuribacterales bacterium]|nr:hypothetical protein [Candidatus Obscuribacterales bacterium]